MKVIGGKARWQPQFSVWSSLIGLFELTPLFRHSSMYQCTSYTVYAAIIENDFVCGIEQYSISHAKYNQPNLPSLGKKYVNSKHHTTLTSHTLMEKCLRFIATSTAMDYKCSGCEVWLVCRQLWLLLCCWVFVYDNTCCDIMKGAADLLCRSLGTDWLYCLW